MAQKPIASHSTPKRLWTDPEVTEYGRLAKGTLAQWRYLGRFTNELPYRKVGRSIRYQEDDVLAFFESCKVGVLKNDL